MRAVCICCNTNSRFCTLCPHSHPSAGTQDQLLSSWFPPPVQPTTPTSSQTPGSRQQRMLPSSSTTKAFHIGGTRSVVPNLSCREIVDRSRCVGESSHLSSQRDQFLLQLCDNLLHRLRHSRSFNFSKFMNFVWDFRQLLLLRFTALRFDKQHDPATPDHQTIPQLSSPGQLSTTTQRESSNDHQNSALTKELLVRNLCATTTHVTSPITTLPWWNNMTMCHMPWNDFLSHSCGARVSVWWIGTDTTLDQDWGTERNCVCMYIVHCRVIVDNKCEFQQDKIRPDKVR